MESTARAAGSAEGPRALPRVQKLIDRGRQQQLAHRGSWWDGVLELLRGLFGPPILRHAIAALRRGNLEAAFALLREEVTARPGVAESAQLFWNVALSCQRAAEAAEPMARLVRTEANDGRLEEATNHWLALVGDVPETALDAATLSKLLPVLRARDAAARGEAAQRESRAQLVDALRRCVDAEHAQLNPTLALRVVEEARGVDIEVARRAVEVALTSTSLHEAKRTRLEELRQALERGEWPEATALPAEPDPPRTAAAAAAPAAAKKPAAAKPPAAKAKPAKPAAAKPAPKSAPAKAKPAPKPAPAAERTRKAVVPPEETPPPSPGRRTVALTQDEIEAASSRLAERMAARKAPPAAAAPAAPAPAVVPAAASAPAAAPAQAPAAADAPLEAEPLDAVPEAEAIAEPLDAVAALEPDAPPAQDELEKDEPIAILEEEDAQAILAHEADDEGFEFGGAAEGPDVSDAVEVDMELETDGDLDADTPLETDELEPEAAPADAAADDFEIGSALDAIDALAAGEAVAAEPEHDPNALTVAPAAAPVPEASPAPAASEAPALRSIDILPVEIGADGLVAFEVANTQRTRIDFRAIEAIAAAEIEGLAEQPVVVVLLVLRARPGRPRSALRMRADAFDPASLYPDRSDAGQALSALLQDLLERTRAVPLPDPDSALLLRPQRYPALEAFEAAVKQRLG